MGIYNHSLRTLSPKIWYKAWSASILTAFSIGISFSLALQASTQANQGTNTNNSVSTTPVGFVSINITAGTGVSKRVSLISLPLLTKDTSIPTNAKVSAVNNANSINYTTLNSSDSGSTTIPDGYLSNPAEPFLIHFTSGNAEGFMLLVSTTIPNTSSTLTLTDPSDTNLNLTNMGVSVNDEFKIYPCDTLLSFFGTPETTLVAGGANARGSDNIVSVFNGSASTYYYNTSLNRWTRVGLGSQNANNTPLLPFYGVQYSRIASTPLTLVAVGEVPTGKRKAKVKGTGTTILSSYWPVDTALAQSPLRNIGGWRMGPNQASADRVVLTSNGSASTYFNTGTNWKRVSFGSPLSDHIVMPLGTAVMIKKTTPGTTITTIEDQAPYSF